MVIPLLAFWCLSDAALKATSSAVTGFLLAPVGWVCEVPINPGVKLGIFGSAPVGNPESGNLPDGP